MKNNKITIFSFVCAALVVQLHIGLLTAVVLNPIGRMIRQIVSHGICQIAVPFFFVVSGYFLARHFDEAGWYRRELFKRLRSLAVPYLFWSIVVTAAIFMALLCLRDLPSYDEILHTAPCGIARWQRFPAVRVPQSIASSSFAIFVLHTPVIFLLDVVFVLMGVRERMVGSTVAYFAEGMATVLVCVSIAGLWRLVAPRSFKVAFGGR